MRPFDPPPPPFVSFPSSLHFVTPIFFFWKHSLFPSSFQWVPVVAFVVWRGKNRTKKRTPSPPLFSGGRGSGAPLSPQNCDKSLLLSFATPVFPQETGRKRKYISWPLSEFPNCFFFRRHFSDCVKSNGSGEKIFLLWLISSSDLTSWKFETGGRGGGGGGGGGGDCFNC